MSAMARSTGFPDWAVRNVGATILFGAAILAVGFSPGKAQTSQVTFEYQELGGDNNTTLKVTDPNLLTGTITYNGTGIIGVPTGPGFQGVTGIEFVNSSDPTFGYSLPALGTSQGTLTSFSPFFLLGTCPICKNTTSPGEQIEIVEPSSAATIQRQGSLVAGGGVAIGGNIQSIRFGSTGSPGIITFSAFNLVQASNSISEGTGSITLSFIQDTTGVPGPLPILGASTAFAFSRRLRRKVSIARAVE
jgi:hypothetical protein